LLLGEMIKYLFGKKKNYNHHKQKGTMNTEKINLTQDIINLKKKRKAVFLAHNYQIPEVQELADYKGDSLELAKISRELDAETIVICGVKFMAETAKILSPNKKIILPVIDAGCPLADMAEPDDLVKLKEKYPDSWVVSYVNTSASVKALSDVCCTSSNAVSVVRKAPKEEIIFVPDRNLASWVESNVPEKKIIRWPGFCPVHDIFSLDDLIQTKQKYSHAKVMVHPECRMEVLNVSDYVCSTAGMLNIAHDSDIKEFIVGTEEGMIYRLEKENPQKKFYSIGFPKICQDMKKITLESLYDSLDKDIHQIEVDLEVSKKAKIALERMVKYV